MSGSPASLVALPNELLSIILQQIDEKDRLSIAYACRRLNDFVASLSLGRLNKYLQSYSNLWICSGHHTTCPNIVCLKDLCQWVVNPPRIPVMNIKFSDNYLGQLRLLTHYIERFPESERPTVHVHVGYQNRWSDMKTDSQLKKLNTFLTGLAELKCVASFLTPYNDKKAALLDTAKRKNN
ncbi:uncharacterized protein EV420DRAFT_1640985 [Desarmillaria tabescens]|uniref:F-box domain-containing protein n=1 Tax=Armillaria tabescens TaxID=1929756 RepID=A0AA39TUZ3_ARMTA|nr:uncharacterized protein EV420DRAFT_1640985 [Desarmillaria tabescens]KAK0460440.1 hypothetical protein EV420DRAFT_1640985 [Desarmillaria tabescens]